MKRIVLILMTVLTLIALGILLSPMVIGHLVEKQYPKYLSRLFPNKGLKFTVLKYHRGWYIDRAQVKIDGARTGFTLNGKQSIIINQTLHIGPILRQANGGYAFQLARIESSTTLGNALLKSDASLDYHGHLVSDTTLSHGTASSNLETVTLGQLNWAHKAWKNYKENRITLSDLSVKEIQAKQAPAIFQASGLHMSLSEKGKGTAKTSNITLNVQEVKSQPADKAAWSAKEAMFQQTISHEAKTASIQYRLVAKSFTLGNNPPHTVDFNYTVNGLDGQVLARLTKNITNSNKSAATKQWAIIRDVFALLQHGLSLTLNKLFLTTPDGPVIVTGVVQLPAPPAGTSPLHISARLKATFHGQAPRKWLVSLIASHRTKTTKALVNTQIDVWIKAGLMKTSAQQLSFDAVYKKGQLYFSSPDYSRLAKFSS